MACCRSWKKLSCRSRSRVMSDDRPQRHARLGDALERANADAVPGRRAFAGQGRGHAQFFDRAIARARGLRQPVDRLGHFRRAGEQPLDEFEVRRALGARQGAIGVIGVNDARIGVGDDQPVAVAVGDGLGRVIAAGAARELQLAERVEQNRENAENRQPGDGPGHGLDAEFSRQQQERRHRAAEADDEQQQQSRVGGPIDAVDRGRPRR